MIKDDILDLSRQNNIAPLTPWFDEQLDHYISTGAFPAADDLEKVSDQLVSDLVDYRTQTGVSTVVLGMSGGVDSALTAALFKKAGWTVIGVTMPIHQNPEETDRGVEACKALEIDHVHIDLSGLYDETLGVETALDLALLTEDTKAVRIRKGNVRARLRMITLYNLASMKGGLVASTDNASEAQASFWTIAGDIGDVAPIQSLTKSWEVPFLARLNGVPEATWRATPTDGLGIAAGDEAQLGCSYLEWDIMFHVLVDDPTLSSSDLTDERAKHVYKAVTTRMSATWYKRFGTVNLKHPFHDRYGMLADLDQKLFHPECVK